MKGIGLAAVQARGPSSRGSGDLDLWVHDDDIARTVEVLRSLGYRPEEPAAVALVTSRSRRARMYRWITPEVTLLHDDGPPIDLHFRLLRSTSHVPIDFGSAWGRSVVIPGTHEQGRTLCAGDALRHSSAHATKDCWDTLRHVVDVVHLARAVDGAELTRLCETDRSVDLAVAVASNLDPQLGRFRSSSARTTRLARTAWTMCLSLAMRPQTIATQPTMTNIRSRAAVLIWQVRTSPDARTALHPIIEAPLSMRALSDPAPLPIGVLKDLVARTRENRT